jgi:hypothetical protein
MVSYRECVGDPLHSIRMDERKHKVCSTCLGLVCGECAKSSEVTRCKMCHCPYKPRRVQKCLDHSCPCAFEVATQCQNCQVKCATEFKKLNSKKEDHRRSRSHSDSDEGALQKLDHRAEPTRVVMKKTTKSSVTIERYLS